MILFFKLWIVDNNFAYNFSVLEKFEFAVTRNIV